MLGRTCVLTVSINATPAYSKPNGVLQTQTSSIYSAFLFHLKIMNINLASIYIIRWFIFVLHPINILVYGLVSLWVEKSLTTREKPPTYI